MTYRDFIQTKLNQLAETAQTKYMGMPVVLFVHENEGEFKAKTKGTQREPSKYIIHSMLLDEGTMPIAVQGLNAFEKKQTLEVVVPVDLTATDYEQSIHTGGVQYIYDLLDVFTRSLIGETGNITVNGEECPFVLGVSKPEVGQIATYVKIGKAIPISVEFTWQVFVDGVFGNNVKLELALPGSNDYIETIKIDGKVVRTRTGDTNQYATAPSATPPKDAEENKTTINQQSLIVTAIIPYKKSAVPIQLVRDMWQGNLKRVYRVRQYDGVAFTEDAPFEAEMVASEIQMPMTAGAPLTITVTLTISGEEEDNG